MNIVLVHPEIPGNTGNIARSCVAFGVTLHLIHPLGFQIDDRHLRRAGLDYWKDLDLVEHEDLDALFQSSLLQEEFYCFSRFAEKSMAEVSFGPKPTLVFGSETKGLPDVFSEKFPERMIRIPTTGPVRSLNLSSAAAIAIYQALRAG